MAWTRLTLDELEEMIACGLNAADDQVQTAWNAMRIKPEKWRCSPWGDDGGGFWVVAEMDGHVVWYNDIEDGFNTSRFSIRGRIDDYACNQTTFEEFLCSLPEAKEADNWSEHLATGIVPPAIQSGGTIVRRQTTYWTIQWPCGSCWRMHFKSKAETRFLNPQFSKLELVELHPFLDQYNEPWADLFFTGTPSNPSALVIALSKQVSDATSGWRNIEEYLNKSASLQKGYGLLMRAPISIVRKASALLGDSGIKTSALKTVSPETGYRAVIMGKNVVVARSFWFEHDDGSHGTDPR